MSIPGVEQAKSPHPKLSRMEQKGIYFQSRADYDQEDEIIIIIGGGVY